MWAGRAPLKAAAWGCGFTDRAARSLPRARAWKGSGSAPLQGSQQAPQLALWTYLVCAELPPVGFLQEWKEIRGTHPPCCFDGHVSEGEKVLGIWLVCPLDSVLKSISSLANCHASQAETEGSSAVCW